MIAVGSLFAGIGGFDLGLERAGMKTVWQVEIDEYCRKVLANRWPDVERYSDVRDCGSHNLERVDVVCGGFPCQPVSHAGQRKGDADERWLWPEFARVVRELEPRWVLAENVPGLLSIDDGRLFGTILRDLASLRYAVEWECIPAAAVGAPHIRDRLWILGYTAGHNARQPRIESHHKQAGPSGAGFRRGLRLESCGSSQDVAHDDGEGCPYIQRECAPAGSYGSAFVGADDWRPESIWSTEPDVGRVAHGVPARVDRLRALGNAVVPQVVEWIGRWIVEADK